MIPVIPQRTLLAAILTFSGLIRGLPATFAQDTGAPPRAATTPPVLKGPAVNDRNVPGSTPDFGMDPAGNGRRAERVPPEVFRRALGVLTAEDAPAEIRATPEQRARIKEFVEGFEQSVRRFRRENANAIESLREAAGEPARNAPRRENDRRSRPNESRMDALSPEQQKAREDARVRLRELMAAAPKLEDVYTKAWAQLSDARKDAVEERLDEWRAVRAKEREEAYVKRRTSQRPPSPPPARRARGAARPDSDDPMVTRPTEGAPPESPRTSRDARRERLVRLFNQLSPEEQEQLLQRLEARFNGRRNNAAPDRAIPKPPPDPERVKVPSPEPMREK